MAARSSRTLLDLLVLTAAYWLAYLLRFDWDVPHQMWKRLVLTWPYVVGCQYLLLVLFGIPRFAWRQVGLREAIRIGFAAALAAAMLLGARFLSPVVIPVFDYALYALIPIGIILIDGTAAFLGITGVRMLSRIFAEKAQARQRRREGQPRRIPTLLVGAGKAGLVVAKEIAARPDLGIEPIGFLDDDGFKVGTVVHGIRVLGSTAELPRLCERTGAEQVVITIAGARGADIRRIRQLCDKVGLPTKIVPGIYEIMSGQVNLSRIRPVAIEDLLRREPVKLHEETISAAVQGRTILVTGAGGSIGSELCRQVSRFQPAQLVLVDQAENGLFHIERELREHFPAVPMAPCIADVCDERRMASVLGRYKPAMVLHAAAHKHVPMMEINPGEAVKNNILGTRRVADLADAHGVERFVMISTDKAVNPSSVMGATKRIAEMYLQALSQRSKTSFVTVRFGNVLGSAGSVVPIFQAQIAQGGPVSVTHPEMSRYFMTIPEACQLVLQSGAMGKGGEIFILDMGEPVKIVDLARDLIELSGFRPGEDIEIHFTGVRPGEKLFEELSMTEEHADKTRHPKIFVGRARQVEWDEIVARIAELVQMADSGDPDAVRALLARAIPEYSPQWTREPAEPGRAQRSQLSAGVVVSR
jgi:FlaA1/EpsC-like NDP-sugar epimerase